MRARGRRFHPKGMLGYVPRKSNYAFGQNDHARQGASEEAETAEGGDKER